MFNSDGTLRIFKAPKVQANVQANTFVISGSSDVKSLKDILPSMMSAFGDNKKKEDDMPDLVESNLNFEEVAKKDA